MTKNTFNWCEYCSNKDLLATQEPCSTCFEDPAKPFWEIISNTAQKSIDTSS